LLQICCQRKAVSDEAEFFTFVIKKMAEIPLPEYWLSGPVSGIPQLLQPVAHALLQARREVGDALVDFPAHLLWEQPKGVASVGFHLQHLQGVLHRLFTYARGEQLNTEQLLYLKQEGIKDDNILTADLLKKFNEQVEKALMQLQETDPETLTQERGVGRKQIPSTVTGLLFHAAEHTMRHTGQLLVTVKMLSA
jgi:uncharacterized damage-inducible protein DinB